MSISGPTIPGIIIDELVRIKITPIGIPDLTEWRKIVEHKNPFQNTDGTPPTDDQLIQLLVTYYTSVGERLKHAIAGALFGAEFVVFGGLRRSKTQWEIDSILAANAEYLKVFLPNLITNYYNSMIKTLPVSLSLSVSIPKFGYVDNQWTHPVTGLEVVSDNLTSAIDQIRAELAKGL